MVAEMRFQVLVLIQRSPPTRAVVTPPDVRPDCDSQLLTRLQLFWAVGMVEERSQRPEDTDRPSHPTDDRKPVAPARRMRAAPDNRDHR